MSRYFFLNYFHGNWKVFLKAFALTVAILGSAAMWNIHRPLVRGTPSPTKDSNLDLATALTDYRFAEETAVVTKVSGTRAEKDWLKAAELKFLNATQGPRQSQAYAWSYLGNVYLKENKYAEALSAYSKALEIKPANKDIQFNVKLARSLAELGKKSSPNYARLMKSLEGEVKSDLEGHRFWDRLGNVFAL
jgi:tetratricopeptide (TPR) repeat protein